MRLLRRMVPLGSPVHAARLLPRASVLLTPALAVLRVAPAFFAGGLRAVVFFAGVFFAVARFIGAFFAIRAIVISSIEFHQIPVQ